MATSLGLLTFGLAGWVIGLLVSLFLLVCVLLILIVLIQRPQGGGLAGAFGMGAGSSQTAFGAKTGDALTFATIGIFVFYIVAAVGLNFALDPEEAAAQTPDAVSTDPASNSVPSPSGGTVPVTPMPVPVQPIDGGASPIRIEPVPVAPPAVTPDPAPAAPEPAPSTEPEPTPAPDPEPAPAQPASPDDPPAEPGAQPSAEPEPAGE
ncbi:MAG: preprotein translocase subunit SecG [Phycisphaeraceae bacterium]|nr:preprotein translocase subunit SecG [Phycisphaeraceae bacterium]